MPSAFRCAIAPLLAILLLCTPSSARVAANGDFAPSEAVAKQNGFQIFNAVHSAVRQWGSSLNHNGLSLFLATVPEGVLLYHGTHTKEPPLGPEWLSFEIEHAENFARPRRQRPPPDVPSKPGPPPEHQLPLHGNTEIETEERDDPRDSHGYLQIYQTARPVRLLYIDGMGAAKTSMGTLDTQDFLLRGNRSTSFLGEGSRAADLCEIATSWGLQGVIRMEAGFEIIKCDFSDSLRLVSSNQRPGDSDRGGTDRPLQTFEYMRAVSQRYHSIGSNRVAVDYSSMVSALFYPLNLTNPDPSYSHLPRLISSTDAQLKAVKSRVADVVHDRRNGDHPIIDWQGVVDMVVARYADKLIYMAEGVNSVETLMGEVNGLLNLHIDYAEDDKDFINATKICTAFFTNHITPFTQEDYMVLAGIESVTASICSALFAVRKIVVTDHNADDKSLAAGRAALQVLVKDLKWSKWKECGRCGYDEVCFVAMWPFGDKMSHEQPNCRNRTSVEGIPSGNSSYWPDFWWPRPKPESKGRLSISGHGDL